VWKRKERREHCQFMHGFRRVLRQTLGQPLSEVLLFEQFGQIGIAAMLLKIGNSNINRVFPTPARPVMMRPTMSSPSNFARSPSSSCIVMPAGGGLIATCSLRLSDPRPVAFPLLKLDLTRHGPGEERFADGGKL